MNVHKRAQTSVLETASLWKGQPQTEVAIADNLDA